MKKENWLKLRDEVNQMTKEEILKELDLNGYYSPMSKEGIRQSLMCKRLDWLAVEEGKRKGLYYTNDTWITKLDFGVEETVAKAYEKALKIIKGLQGVEIGKQDRINGKIEIIVHTPKRDYFYKTKYQYVRVVVGQVEEDDPFGFEEKYMRDIYGQRYAITFERVD
jgi:hypothetical protein